MYHIAVGGFVHETNTFSPFPTQLRDFTTRGYRKGEQLLFGGKTPPKSVQGAHVGVLASQPDVEIIPTVDTSAVPSGAVTAEAFETVLHDLLEPMKGKKIDGVLLCLHGAMVSDVDEDADGYLLEKVRETVGKDAVIAATLDLHVNLSQRMTDAADILIPYMEYPHADGYERGLQTVRILLDTLRGNCRPVMTRMQIPTLTALIDTNEKPYAPIREVIEAQNARPGVLYANMTHGFYMSDTRDTRACALVLTDGDRALGQDAAQKIYDTALKYRENIIKTDSCSFEEAYQDAMTRGEFPVVFADVCDNPGAGGTCDAPHILRKLLEAGAQNAAYAMLVDPDAVQKCFEAGIGSTVQLSLGSKKAPQITGEPVQAQGYVKFLSDGEHINYGPMHTGNHTHLGKCAVVVIGGVTVLLSSNKTQVYDLAPLISNGMYPENYDIIVMKSTIHYRAAVQAFSKKNYSVSGPSLYTLNILDLQYQRVLPGTYPLREKE